MTREELYEFVKRHRYAVVSTTHAGGWPQSALVGIAVAPSLEIYFDTVGTTRKAVNFRRDPRVSLVIGWDNEQSLQLEGLADEPKGDALADLKRVYYAAWPDGPSRESWADITWVRVIPGWACFSDFNRAEDAVRRMRLD